MLEAELHCHPSRQHLQNLLIVESLGVIGFRVERIRKLTEFQAARSMMGVESANELAEICAGGGKEWGEYAV